MVIKVSDKRIILINLFLHLFNAYYTVSSPQIGKGLLVLKTVTFSFMLPYTQHTYPSITIYGNPYSLDRLLK